MNFSVKSKLLTLFIIVLVIAVSAVGWFGFKSAKESYMSSALALNEGSISSLSSEIQGIFQTIPNDIIYNANFFALKKLLVWEDLKDKQNIKEWKNIYISALKDYILNKKLYYQVRILDLDGNEKILLKYDRSTDKIIETAEDNLKNKAHRGYFKNSIKLKKGEFYISEMTLNIEYGMIEKPYIPVVRYATPIIDANGETKGVIVLNFDAKYILKEITDRILGNVNSELEKYYLINEEGYYLYHENKNKRWGFQLGNRYNFKSDYHKIFELFKDKDSITFIKNNEIFLMHKIYPNQADNPYRFWYLVKKVDSDMTLVSLNTFINIFVLILFSTLFFGLMIINWYISKIMTPLGKVTQQLKALSKGEIKKEHIIYEANDEITQIVKSTDILVNAIETTINQANSVANGDLSKEIDLLSKNDRLGLALRGMTLRLKEISLLSTNLSTGNYDVNIIAKSSEDKLGLSLIDMVNYLKNITELAESIAIGDLNVKYIAKGKNDRLGRAILQMIKYLKVILKQANAISNEDFTHTVNIKSKNDELGIALGKMTDMLRESSIQNENEIYFSEGVSNFSDKLAGITDTQELASMAISLASRYVDASSGVLYTYDPEKRELNLISSYAYTSRDSLSNNFKLGKGIVGQVGLEKKEILLKNIRDDFYLVETGTTVSNPKEVYAFPLVHEGELFGVCEIMSFGQFSKIHRDYLKKIAAIFSSSLHTTTQNAQIKILLEKSQSAYEELQVQSEELQESNVQMEEQQQQLTLQSQELREKNDTLATAKQEIDKRAEDLEKTSKYKSEFLANMSHELRTPLNSIILLSKLLTNNSNKTLNKKDIEKSAVIHKAGNDLLLLINDILDLSKVESGNMELESMNITTSEVVDDLEGLFSAVAQEKNLIFNINDNYKDSFISDKTKLLQVLKNLLSNALKFTKEGSVSIDIYKENTNLVFKVSDTGIGIPSDKLDTIFEAFKQVDGSISREFGGTGLGLSISKTIVNLMKGELIVESKYGEGSAFIVTIPINKEEQILPLKIVTEEENENRQFKSSYILSQEDEEYIDSDKLSGKNILIVDDDSRNIFALTSTLESMNAEVFSAFNGKEAIEILNDDEEDIDLILMDIMMPVMDGLLAIKNIKANDRFKHIPIIAITAKTMPEDKQSCLDAGANDYLAKPINHQALVRVLNAWIE